MWTEMAGWQKALTVILAIVGLIAIAAGIIYLALPAKSLPSFFPAYAAHSNKHGTKHAIVALAVGVIALVLAWLVPFTAKRARY